MDIEEIRARAVGRRVAVHSTFAGKVLLGTVQSVVEPRPGKPEYIIRCDNGWLILTDGRALLPM